ncbi:MAG: hypothetical protein WC713_11460 [Candidatus Methylomirabilota bacterium]
MMKKFNLLVALLLGVLMLGAPFAHAFPTDLPIGSPEVLALQTEGALPAGTIVPAAPAAAAVDPAKPAGETGTDPTVGELTEAGKQIYSDWVRLGWMGGVAALCGFLLLLLRLKKLDEWLTNKDWKKWKPWVSAFIGAVGGFFSYLVLPDMTWANWPQAVTAGLMAGFAMVGVHQGFGGAGPGKGDVK